MISITTETLSILHELMATLEIRCVTAGADRFVYIKISGLKYTAGTYITMDEYKKSGTMVLAMLLCEFKKKGYEKR